MSGLKPKNLGHYWRLKRDQEILALEAKKKADEIYNLECEWEDMQLGDDRRKIANKISIADVDLVRLQGKVAKLQIVLEAFENSLPKKVPIEIDGGMGDGDDKG